MTANATAVSRRVFYPIVSLLLLCQSAPAQHAAFRLGPPNNGVPTTFADITYPADRIVIYDLPATGPNAAVAETPDGFIDLIANVSGAGTVQAAGYGVILSVTGGGTGLEFDPETVVGDTPNMGAVKNPLIIQNTSFLPPRGAAFGDENVPGMIAGNQSVGIAAIYTPTPPNQDTAVRNNDGLTAIPVDVRPGLTHPQTHIKEFTVSFVVDDEFTGFVNTAGNILTNSSVFPHIGATVQIRKSIQGDLNGDGFVNAGDTPAFLSAIDNALLVQNQAPWLRLNYIADFNADLVLDARDIPGFEQACGCVVPEPSTIGLATLALLLSVAGCARRIKR